jgi:uncharacterized protein Yka (UPF0111/DUF47 family)
LETQGANLVKATSSLFELVTDYEMVAERNSKIKDLEHEGDKIYRTAIAELFETDNAIEIIKLKDIYETLEGSLDRCQDVADIVEDIALKYG